MKICIIGTGYVGLTIGASLAYLGHKVTFLDIDANKIAKLKNDVVPFHEPKIQELLNLSKNNINFTISYSEAIPNSEVIFITVGTPSLSDGTPDLSSVDSAAKTVAQHLPNGMTIIVNKSTVPVGTAQRIEKIILGQLRERNSSNIQFSVVSNPEFVREGSAVYDTLYPDRVIVGTKSNQALDTMQQLYKPILEQTFPDPDFISRPRGMGPVPLVATDVTSAELIKYAANAFLATKISFINEISTISEKVGADILLISKALGLDSRIGPRFLQAGIGWGGSCFGKDTSALLTTATEFDIELPIVEAARKVNFKQRTRVINLLKKHLGSLEGKTIGLLGLSFKPNTDDLRDAPSLEIATNLINCQAHVRAYDPISMEKAKKQIPDISFCDSVKVVAKNADALVLITEWSEFLDVPWEQIAPIMKQKIIIDGRNILNRDQMIGLGFIYSGIGR